MPTPILIVLALVVLSVLVLVHELGHLIAARLAGVWVEEFGIGLPPRVWGKKIGETVYSINALPLGGFVRLHGETPGEEVSKPEKSFRNKPKIARALVALAGIAMNLVFATACLSATFWLLGVDKGVEIVGVKEGSPAGNLGLQEGDEVLSFAGKDIDTTIDFPRAVEEKRGQEVEIVVLRGEETLRVSFRVGEEYIEGQGFTGIEYKAQKTLTPPLWQRPFVYTYYGVEETSYWIKKTLGGFVSLFTQVSRGQVPQGLAGPFGVTLTIAEIFKYGIVNVLTFTAIISVNLALINILPIPPLDGSRVVLLGVEGIVGVKRLVKIEKRILEVGMAALLLLILLITISEIPKLISAGSVSSFVNSLFGS